MRSDSRQEVEVGADSTGQHEQAGRIPPAGRLSYSRSRSTGFSKNEARSPDFLLFLAFGAEHGASVWSALELPRGVRRVRRIPLFFATVNIRARARRRPRRRLGDPSMRGSRQSRTTDRG